MNDMMLGIAGEENGGLSYNVWKDAPVESIRRDRNKGWMIDEDFTDCPVFASNTPQSGGQITYQDSGVTIRGKNALGGGLRISTPATDNAEGHHQRGGNVAGVFSVDASAIKDLWHEQRVAVGQLAETAAVVGLGEPGLAAENTLVDNTGALASKDFIGFHCPTHASAAKFAAVYRKEGQAMVTVEADVWVPTADVAGNLAVVVNRAKKRLSWFVNGVEACYIKLDTVSLTTFPSGVLLMPLRGMKNGEASAKTFDCLRGLTVQSAE